MEIDSKHSYALTDTDLQQHKVSVEGYVYQSVGSKRHEFDWKK